MKTNNKAVAAALLMLLAAFIWGFSFVVVKNSLDLVPPIYMMALRFTIAAVAMVIIFWKRMKTMTLLSLKKGSIIGVSLFLAYILQTYGCRYTTAGKNAFLTTIYVILVPIMHFFVSKKKLKSANFIGAFMAIVGIGLLSLDGDLTINIGDVLTLFCGVSFAAQFILIDMYSEGEDMLVLTTIQIGFTAAASWITAPIAEGALTGITFNADLWRGMLYLGILSTMVGFAIQNVCVKYTHPATASVVLSLESVFGTLCGVIFLHEVMTVRMIIGCVIMFAAILLVELKGENGA